MKIKIHTIFLLILFNLCLGSCGHDLKSHLSEKEKLDMIDELKDFLYTYQQNIKLKGLSAELNYLDSSADFFWIPPGYNRPLSYDSVLSILKQNASKFKRIENQYFLLTIHPLSHKLASFSAVISSVVTDSSNTTNNHSLIESGIIVKRQSGWKLLSGQTTNLNH